MKKQHEPTATDLVIERYAIENAQLKLQIAHQQIELNKVQEKNKGKSKE